MAWYDGVADFFTFGQYSKQKKRAADTIAGSNVDPGLKLGAGVFLGDQGLVDQGRQGLEAMNPFPATYDLTDSMVQASRRLAAKKATGGFGLTDTFITRSLDNTAADQAEIDFRAPKAMDVPREQRPPLVRAGDTSNVPPPTPGDLSSSSSGGFQAPSPDAGDPKTYASAAKVESDPMKTDVTAGKTDTAAAKTYDPFKAASKRLLRSGGVK